MSGVLSSLGITAPAVPSPSTYANQKEENANLNDARANLNSTVSSINLAIQATKLAGLPPAYTQNLTDLATQAKTLGNSTTLTSDEIAKQTAAIDTKLGAAQAQQASAIRQQTILDMIAAKNKVEARVTSIRGDSTTSPGLLQQYNDLLTSVNNALDAAMAQQGDISAATPTYPTADEFITRLDELDTLKDAEENKEFNWTRFGNRTFKEVMKWFSITSVAIGAILGGIVMSNAYASDTFWAIKLYYFVYGTILFPLSLLYGSIKTPYWVSGLIPLYVKNISATDVPDVLMPVVPVPDVPVPVVPVPDVPLPDVPVPVVPLPDIPPVNPVLTGGGSTSFFDPIFGYSLVDPATPTAAETSNRLMLRVLSITDLSFITAAALYYGIQFVTV